MNRVFRIVWSTASNAWVVASELTGKHGKGRGCAASATIDERSSPLRTSQGAWTLRLGVLMGLASLYAAPAFSADRYWDVNGGSAGSGGTGTWDTLSPYWNAASDGVAGPFAAWNNGAIDNAVFAGTAGTVTLASPITLNNLTFSVAGYTLIGGTLTLAGTTPTIAGAGTINSVIAGNAGLIKSAGGTLTLNGANTFSGGITVNAGTLAVANDAALGAASNGIAMADASGLSATAALAASRVVTLNGNVHVAGVGVGSAHFTGIGGVLAGSGVTLSNSASDYTGQTAFNTGGTYGFTSVGDLGEASALGAPTTVANGTVVVDAGGGLSGTLNYSGSGDSSNRNWTFNNTSSGGNSLRNMGTGTLTLSGDIVLGGSWTTSQGLVAQSGDLALLGVISSPGAARPVAYNGTAGRSITLGGANTYTGASGITTITVYAPVLADTGTASSLGTGASGNIGLTSGTLRYTGATASSNRIYTFDGASTLANDGTGGLSLTGASSFTAGGIDSITLGGSYAGTNTDSGVISGTGSVVMNGSGNWVLSGANTYAGTTTVQAGTLTAGSASAFGVSKGLIVNGGTLDLNDLAIAAPSLAGTGGNVDLGSGTLTLNATSGSTSYAGSIGGTGGLTKLGAGTQTLTGANTYTGATTIGGGTLALDFSVAGAPASNIVSSSSTLNLGGGTLSIKGATGATTQAFNGLNVTAGNNRISATAGAGGLGVSLGGINRSGGLVDFAFNTGTTISTTHADGALGGWATVNGTDYAQVSGGIITAFTNYADKDNANTWSNGDIVSDEGGNANTPYTGTVNGSVALGGMKVAAAAGSTVNVSPGNTLSVDGSIIVSPTAGTANQTIQGGSLTGGAAGSPLGVLQNAAGNFTISSTIIDNGGATGFVVGGQGTGTVSLTGANTYTGSTTVSGGTLAFNSVANGGAASAIGASSNDPSNLVLENGTLHYTGATASTDRGFTLVNGGPSRTIQVDGSTDLTFSGVVTSPDDAGFTKTGTGTLTLSNGANDFVGPVTVSAGLLATGTLANGGVASGIGEGGTAPANLVLQNGGGLEYTGADTSTDRGFTLAAGQGHVSVDAAATTLTDSGTIVGAGNLYKDGAGTLLLSGANTYTGGTTITGAILRAGSPTAFGVNGVMTVNAGGTLDASTFQVNIGGLNGAGNVTLGTGGGLTINGNGTFSGAISGAGGVTITGHSETFTGCGNSYTGATIISSSTITTDCLADGGQASGVGASSSLPANLQIAGTLAYTGTSVNINRGMQLTGNAVINVTNATTTLGISGAITGAGQFQKSGPGTLVLSGSNANTAGTFVSGGTLGAGVANAFGTGYMTLANTAGVLLDLNSFNTNVSYLDGAGTTGGNIDLGSATLTVTTGSNATGGADFGGAISGTGNLVKNGTALQTLSGAASDYTGTTTVNAGTLQVDVLANGGLGSSIGASSNAAGNLVLNGGTLQYSGTGNSTDRLLTLGPSASSALNASGSGAVQFTNTGALAFSGANTAQTVTLTGSSTADNSLALQITDNGTGKTSVSKTSGGTWILRNAASTYTGVTTISGGVLGVDHLTNGGQASSIGSSSNAASNLVIGTSTPGGATLRYTGTGDTTDRLFTLLIGSSVIESSGTGAIVFSNTGSAAYAGSGARTLGLGGANTGNNTMGGSIIDGTGGVTTLAKNDAGTWLLTGNNTYTGNTVVNTGLLQIGNGGTTGSIASPTVIVDTAGTLGFDRSDTSTLAGTISGAGDVVQSGTGTTVLTATNTYTGGTAITAGVLQLGNGGANGSILGNVADNGTLAFDRSDVYTFGGLVTGTGGVTQLGSGTMVLTGTNSYAGATNVQAGTLLIDGNQSAATGGTTVQNGATLGGVGTIGGSVTVASGGALNPGDAGAAGTLTINGGLTLGANSTLNYQFGQPNVVGGSLNDLTVVHGNLNLDGTLNVSATPGGSFGPGLYRIISYDGTLNDQGLALGGSSTGNYQVQTSVANQVNLINTGGLTLNFWDGANGHTNNTVDGGNGVWQNSAGNSNWTSQTGQVNAPYTDGEFSIFMGAPGTVTVDNTLGTVTSSGMQFAVNGYTVTGDPITFVSGQDVVRVGDGTAAGAGMTATITAPLNGAGTLVKEDLGTLIINSINNLTGGTAINGGVLQVQGTNGVGAPGAAVSFDGGTLRTTQSSVFAHPVTINQGGGTFDIEGTALIVNQTIGGAGQLTKMGPGTLTLSATNTYAGGTAINGGALKVSSDANLGNAAGALSFDGGTLNNTAAFTSARGVTLGNGGGTFDTTADLTLAGTVGGPGTLNKIDAGALVLTADNTYTGGTTIASGVLQLGNGGTSGSIQGNVANNGTLVFDRTDSVAFAGAISGTGALEQQDTGTTVLSAANSYTGPTAVRAGSLIINGDQSAATGATTVDSGGTLGGKGIIGGDVSVADGGTLSPGDVGSAPGTLTVKGSLALSDASNLNVNLGQANVVGGPLNDLVQVNGDLTLDGTLNVSVTSGGTFDPGIYRIIGYTGALTNNGFNIGSVPSPDYFLQTSIAQQVNLVNTNGLSVNFWDGNGARGDDLVQGGDGVWQGTTGNDNWTLLDGSINASYQDSSFAVFAGAAGTVTVDATTQGAVNASGMQFATDGYRVEGDAIALVGSAPVIRVGDGTTAGAAMTATIASVLTGSNGMTKSDLGTLVLAGNNTYTGGTTITGGTLQLGEGGTSGSIVGDVVDNGALAFDRSDVQTIGAAISGTGGVTQMGNGTTTLTSNNSYTGATTVSGGTLLVDGDQSAATGATTVQNGGTLGGSGTIGGDVTVANGGTLSPGNSPGTLTVNGNLTLNAGATVDYQLGQAGTVGGSLNDLTVVHGNLTLDGTLNVSTTPGGTFGAGVYRLFNYDGTLTDNGLAIGTSPTANVFVQTSLANQVNLVNTDGLTLTFWDGPGHANDGAITGGTGTWRLADNDYWTDASGTLNAPFTNGSFAIFGGTGGTVTVDNTNGQVSASGMQFQADGYRVTGDAIELAGGASTIRVGDGTAAGASMTATIDAALTGASMLVKDDLGTLVLTGANSYGGGTDVHAGTLQVANDGNLGLAAGSLSIDDATLHTTGSFLSNRTVGLGGAATIDTDDGTTLQLSNGIQGTGSLTKNGTGTLMLGGTSTYGGDTTVAAGTLSAAVANAFNASSATTVQSGATLDLAGFAQRTGALTNAGTVNFGHAPGTSLTVQGDYAGQGGTLNFNTALGGDGSATDMLVVTGNTSGNTTVQVTNVGGTGAATTQGIKLIDVQGASNGTFALKGDYVFQGQQAVVAGAYAYRLYKDGVDAPDGDWYLRSALTDPPTDPGNPGTPGKPGAGGGDPTPLYQPGVPLYEAYAGILQQANTLDTLVQRTGDRQWADGQSNDAMTPGEGVWTRVQGGDHTIKPESSTTGTNYDVSDWKSEVGLDATLADSGSGKLVGSASLHYDHYNSDVSSAYGDGRINTRAYGVGAALTWYASNGLYVDGQLRWMHLDSDLHSNTLGMAENDNKAAGYAAGVEVGQRFHLSDAWSIVPQAQLTWGKVSFDGFNDAFGARVSQQAGNAAAARAGTAIDYLSTHSGDSGPVVTHLYAIANVYDNFKDAAQVNVAGTDFSTRNERWWGGLGLGGSLDWAGGRYSVYGEVQAQTGLSNFGDSHALNGTLGFRMRW